ncbi:ABC-2 type transport system ATP-binding protein [Halomicrobium zhouii]|uniref:ABC-2 type transport system ATP-binding protein n=1 Tax=Halomicrobium zhouii TaxID=767519 RepID=A0A1I6LJQ9_9EURY|nr:ABC transporter ATP-binding protein [Halomicrobium zhouii]SFS03631.1 ABC-2 type transport system ATP-binding protein [Halomicrobium zhouii]
MEEVLVAENVRRAYGDTVALDDVSLTLGEGEVVALVGPNGAGKTTLVRALTGTTDAEGRVELFGTSPRDVDRDRIGLLPQDFSPHDRLTARELLAYYAGLYDESRDVDRVLADVGLADDAGTWYENLSGGQQRRTCVGATLVNDPDLLLLDEPTTGIDPAGRHDLWELLEGLADAGVTILVTTHDMEEAHRLADRVGLLADGQLVAMDAPDALIANYGGESRLTVSGDVDESVAAALRYQTVVDGDGMTVSGVAPEDIGAVVRELEEAGVDYDGLSWSEPDLEAVYMELTGNRVGRGDRASEREPTAAPAGGER